jgi:hypothetical protein
MTTFTKEEIRILVRGLDLLINIENDTIDHTELYHKLAYAYFDDNNKDKLFNEMRSYIIGCNQEKSFIKQLDDTNNKDIAKKLMGLD